MGQIYHIKEIKNEEEILINQIAKNDEIYWGVVKKYADSDILPKKRKPTKIGIMYTDE